VDYLKKGQETIISGEVTLNEYQTKEGDKKASLRVRVNDVTLVGSSSAAVTSAQSKPSGQPVARPVDNFDNYDDDIPFN
jgi:single-strand DNA-binding protein